MSGNLLDQFFSGISQLRNAGINLAKQKAANFSSNFALTNNPATGATDIEIVGGVSFVGGYVTLLEVSAGSVATPSTGFRLFVDSSDHRLKAKGSSGTVTTLANP